MRLRFLCSLLMCLAVTGAWGCQGGSSARNRPFWQLEPLEHPRSTDVRLSLKPAHPRLVFRPAADRNAPRTFEYVRQLYQNDRTFRKIFEKALSIKEELRRPAMLAACWIITGEDRYAESALEKMLKGKISRSREPYYSNIWDYALAYDWLYNHPVMNGGKRELIAVKISERLRSELDDLDTPLQALWHGRNQQANGCMIAALAIGDLEANRQLLKRATDHYVDSLRALEHSEGWPEGASYWIYNRAGPYALAADCLMSATGREGIDGLDIRAIMRRVGLWQVYQFAPNGVFEPYGDSAGSLRLGITGWWELTTDHFARLANDGDLMAGADYLRNRSPDPYGKRPYYWKVIYTYDPAVRPKRDYDPGSPEIYMRNAMPRTLLFGRNSLGVAFLRGAWGDPDECYASFKAGDLMAHHDHYDAGHFSIQCGGLLAPQTGLYGPGGYFGDHRLGYSIQTVSSNSLLVMSPGETSAYLAENRARGKCRWDSLAGGQRLIMPTGFFCVNFEHYRRQLNAGPHLERASIHQFESVPDSYDYISADITAAYNSAIWHEPRRRSKVDLVTRQFLFLRKPRAFVIYDRVNTTRAGFLPKFLLHHLNKPSSATERLLAGRNIQDGITVTMDRRLTSESGRGRLTHLILLPEKARALKIGGPGYNCYVEEDGDPSDGFDGLNLAAKDPGRADPATHLGQWRTEVEPLQPSRQTRFLNVLLPRIKDGARPLPAVKLVATGPEAHAVAVNDRLCVFSAENQPLARLKLTVPRGIRRLLLLDAQPRRQYFIGKSESVASGEGVLDIKVFAAGELELRTR